MIKDTAFYDKESSVYSEKRYPQVSQSYTQFFFKERLQMTINALKHFVGTKKNLSLHEIGCADGYVINEIKRAYPDAFSNLIGTDISPGMITSAQEKFGNSGIHFVVRPQYTDASRHDVIVEIGVINYAVLEEELEYIKTHLKADGVALISLAGQGSIWDRRRTGDTGFNNFLTYKEYRNEISKRFTIIQEIPVGLLIPLLWRIPVLARIVQPLKEMILRPCMPGLFHEKIYVLQLNPGNGK
jgi:SAM-dependent methyltransferase